MALWCICCLGIILLEISDGEEWPSYVITCFYRLEPCGIDGITTHRMHQFYGLLGGRKVVHIVGLSQLLSGFLGWVAGLSLASPLLGRDAIEPAAVADPNEYGLVLACDQDVFFVVNFYVIFGED